jgi:hypothetical protein
MRAYSFIAIALLVGACGGDKPDARATPGESKVAAKAVADVDAAMAEAQAPLAAPPPAVPPLPHRRR